MAVSVDDIIVKKEVTSIFKENLLTAIYAGVVGNNNVPKFNGTQGSFRAPAAIDPGQLDSSVPVEPTIPSEIVTAADTYDALKKVVDGLTKIRYYTSNWYYQSQDALALVETKSGIAAFKPIVSSLPAYNKNQKTEGYSGWSRNIQGTAATESAYVNLIEILEVVNPFRVNELIQANQVQPYTLNATLFNNLFKAWEQVRNKRVTYNYYTCHSNCHSNWTNARRRR